MSRGHLTQPERYQAHAFREARLSLRAIGQRMGRLHKNARTTPAIRREIQASTGSDYELAERFGVTRQTIRKWRNRTTQEDFSHTAHRLQTSLNAGQEELVVELRKTLWLSLDDLLSMVPEIVHACMSRSALNRLLRRRGVSRLPVDEAPVHPTKAFKAY